MPHFCVVDKFGAIAFNGEVKNINLSETISSLIEANAAVSNDAQSQLDGNQQKSNYYAAKQLVRSGLAHPAFSCISALTYDPKLIIKVTREKVFNTKGEVIEKIYKKPEIGFGIKKEDTQVVEEFFKAIDKSNFQVNVEYLENV